MAAMTMGLRRIVLAMGLLLSLSAHALAAPERSVVASAAAPLPAAAKLQALTDLLADPEVQAALARHGGGVHGGGVTEPAAPSAPPRTMALSLADRLQGFRQHIIALAAATRTVSGEADMARDMLAGALDGRGWLGVAGLFAGFVALGFGAEWLFRLAGKPAQRWLLALELQTVNERVRAVFARFAYGVCLVVSFGLGSVGAFLLFDWPVLTREILLGYLIAFLLARLFAVAGRILLAPGAARFRVVPISTPAAAFLFRRWIAVAVVVGFAWQTIDVLTRFGLPALAGELWADAAAVLLVVIGLDIVWRTPHPSLAALAREPSTFVLRHRTSFASAASVVLVLLWVLWVARAQQAFWLLAFAAGLSPALTLARRSVNHILRPPNAQALTDERKTLDVIIFERGVRSVVLVGAALLLGRILHVDFTSLTMDDTVPTRVMRGAISIVVIGLGADFVWHVAKALIDAKVAASLNHAPGDADAGHAARLATLLPIISNFLLVLIVVMAGMMMLASAGVEIGPLIASAGVVGVAIGFGAQTLVKDIISGIFYLFDDAFRIGEYIQSGSYKGTVESFSLRSVKLRHQRGALYTVPFGILGAVQNQSRDWVVDKIALNVPYGTDLERVRKLVKGIGQRLVDDPELGPDILVPLKMQGVTQFGDFAIQIQTKMMTKPGETQFLARRRALLMIDAVFRENGIGFAVPVVHVAGGGEGAVLAPAGQRGFDLLGAGSKTSA